jgi:hypothetical protein
VFASTLNDSSSLFTSFNLPANSTTLVELDVESKMNCLTTCSFVKISVNTFSVPLVFKNSYWISMAKKPFDLLLTIVSAAD